VKLGTGPFLWIPAESGKYQLFTAMNYLGSPERQKEIGTDVRIMVLIEHHQCTLAGAISSASQKRYEDQECVLQCSRGAGAQQQGCTAAGCAEAGVGQGEQQEGMHSKELLVQHCGNTSFRCRSFLAASYQFHKQRDWFQGFSDFNVDWLLESLATKPWSL